MLFGFDAKLYYLDDTRASWGGTLTDGVYVGPAPEDLVEIANVKDITIPVTKDTVDVSTRANNKWKATAATLRDTEITIPMIYLPTDEGLLALMKAYNTDAVIPLAFLDGEFDVVGTKGFWMDAQVTKMEKTEELGGVQMMNFTVKPALTSVPPEAVEVDEAP